MPLSFCLRNVLEVASWGAERTNVLCKPSFLPEVSAPELSEETAVKPKPLVEIGGRPVLWHIMKMYAAHGITDFIVCLGYKGHLIKEFFANYALNMSDMTFDLAAHSVTTHRDEAEEWRVTLIDTGDATMTGGRLARVLSHIRGEVFS